MLSVEANPLVVPKAEPCADVSPVLDVIMPIHVNDIETLHDFAVGIMARAGHRTNQVRGIALAMLGGIIWRVDPGSIEIRFQDSGRANVLRWVSITGYEYTCAYNQQTDQMEIRDRNAQGSVLHTLSNATPIVEVERIFSTL